MFYFRPIRFRSAAPHTASTLDDLFSTIGSGILMGGYFIIFDLELLPWVDSMFLPNCNV
jgi:hypothetical protein